MSSMQIYSNFDYGDKQSLRSFFLENALRHTQYGHLIAVRSVFQVPMFDVFDAKMVHEVSDMMTKPKDERQMPPSLLTWLQLHATLHQAETQIMGLGTNYNIYDADFRDPIAMYDWMQNHSLIHDYEDQILGI